jgi:peptidyl-prolyl cis-trans isomerase B (cyclophilin B)
MSKNLSNIPRSLAALILLCGVVTLPSAVQAQTNAQETLLSLDEQIVPEVLVEQHLSVPNQPLRLRLLLHNVSDQPAEIPSVMPAEDGIRLPNDLILGSTAAPAISLTYQDDAPITLTPIPPAEETPRTIRLAPHGSIGGSLDLTQWTNLVRYTGDFHVTWRPMNGALGEATVEFRVEPRVRALLVTAYGKVTFDLFYDQAPDNVANFLELARRGFYDGKVFHRVVPGFAIQGGSPDGTNRGIRPDGQTIDAEWHNAPFKAGTLAMARKANDPDSASCQIFITLARIPDLDGTYTVIGQASDEASLRTLQRLADVPTDDRYQPVNQLLISSINLVPVNAERTRQIELNASGRVRSTNP